MILELAEMGKTSKYRNVYWYRRYRRWIVKLHVRGFQANKETINVGYYDDEEYAARVADCAERAMFGYDVNPNFPDAPLDGACRTEVLSMLHRHGAISPKRLKELLDACDTPK